MKKQSAGLLVYRKKDDQVEVLIVHPGGPFWANKDQGVWSIPKGLYEDEDPKDAAYREFEEEIGQPAPKGQTTELGTIEQRNNKTVIAWAVEGDLDASNIKSNTIMIDWPPRSGKKMEIPEVDKAMWATLDEASQKLNPDQIPFIKRLAQKLNIEIPETEEQTQQQLL
jgi:predicted NUDIX family NTP pyrophosphohydrolase